MMLIQVLEVFLEFKFTKSFFERILNTKKVEQIAPLFYNCIKLVFKNYFLMIFWILVTPLSSLTLKK